MASAKSKKQVVSSQHAVQTKLQQALALHQSGQLAQAQAFYLEVLQAYPHHADCLHLLGVISAQQQDHQTAANLIRKAIQYQPNNPSFYCNLGNALNALKQFEQAIGCYDKAVALTADFVDAHYNRATALFEIGRMEQALQSFDRVLQLRPDYALAYYAKANVLKALGYFDEASACYRQAISLKPNYVEAHFNLAVLQKEQGKLVEALQSYQHAIRLKPHYPSAYFNRGNVEQLLDQMDAALQSYRIAFEQKPDYAEAYYNYAVVLKDRGQYATAIDYFDRAIQFKADYYEAFFSKGFAFRSLLRMSESLACFDQAIQCRPDADEAYFAKSLALLLVGDYQQGWCNYERRWQVDSLELKQKTYPQPLLQSLIQVQDKTVLLYSEQGLGDSIQFCRYANLLVAQGARRVLLQVQPALQGLLSSLSGPVTMVAAGGKIDSFDYHCSLMSLPYVCQTELTNIPEISGYLDCDAQRLQQWSERLGERKRPRVGLVWSGNPKHKNDLNRSFLLQQLAPYLPANLDYVCLQKVVREADVACLSEQATIQFWGEQLNDFGDTAALCCLMDVVISVDTSVAHLSAALGRPTWVLLPYDPDWRWGLASARSAWYDSASLYRQPAIGAWLPVFEQLATDLETLVI